MALAACGGGSGSGSSAAPSAASAATSGPLTGTATLTTWGAGQEIAAFKKLAADSKAARGADVTIEVLPYHQIRTVVDRHLQADQAPDLFRVSYTDVRTYASSGALADLSGYLDPAFGEAFLPALWGAVQTEGKPFGVPHHTDVSALAYNEDHFAKAGITDVPTSLDQAWTWEPFVDVLRRLFTSMLRWNEFVWPLLVLTDSYTLPVGLQFLISQFDSDHGPLLAMSFLSILPMLLVLAVFQRFFVEGVARTGIT